MEKIQLKYLLLPPLFIVIIQVICGIFIYSAFQKWEDRGLFGDMFGVVNALFSGLAFSGIIITIFIQFLSIKIQHKEIKETEESQRKSELILKRQLETFEFFTRFNAQVHLMDYYDRKIKEIGNNLDDKTKRRKDSLIREKKEVEELIIESHEYYKKHFKQPSIDKPKES